MGCLGQSKPVAETRFEFSQPHMGTLFSLVLHAPDAETAERAADAAFQQIHWLEWVFSDYEPTSELRRLCDQEPGQWVLVSSPLANVLQRSLDLSQQTEGAFDVTLGPMIRQWRRARRQRALPDSEVIEEARSRSGHTLLEVDRARQAVRLGKAGMHLDLGGIAKGVAADAALQVLIQMGCPRALVAASGDIRAGDPPPRETHWRVGVAGVDASGNELTTRVALVHGAVSTSGDTQQYAVIAGQRYSHIVDPKTGLGLTHRLSVTILAPDATTSDSLATAVSVLGVEKGLSWLEGMEGVEGLIVEVDDETGLHRFHRTSGFKRQVLQDGPP